MLSVDTAMKTTEYSDYSVILAFACNRKTKQSYLVKMVRERFEFPDLLRNMEEVIEFYKPQYILIEDKNSGTSLIQTLKQKGIYATPIVPKVEKFIRAMTVAAQLERGELLINAKATWQADFLAEITSYPEGTHDDIVDALSQYFNWLPEHFYPKIGIYPISY